MKINITILLFFFISLFISCSKGQSRDNGIDGTLTLIQENQIFTDSSKLKNLNFAIGETKTYRALYKCPHKKESEDISGLVSWESSNPSVAKFVNIGVLKGFSPGETDIFVSYNGITSEPINVVIRDDSAARFAYVSFYQQTTLFPEHAQSIAVKGDFIYVTDHESNKIFVCKINDFGNFDNCRDSDATGISNIYSTLTLAVNGNYIYVGYSGVSETGFLICTANNSTGLLTCNNNSDLGLPNGTEMRGLVVNNIYAYPLMDDGVYLCDVNNFDGTLSNCIIQSPTLGTTTGITIYNGNVYISGIYPARILSCPIDNSNGTLTACTTNTDSVVGSPMGIITINDRIFSPNNDNDSLVSSCALNIDGTINSCIGTGSGLNAPSKIARNDNYAFIVSNEHYTTCMINDDGTLSSCTTTTIQDLSITFLVKCEVDNLNVTNCVNPGLTQMYMGQSVSGVGLNGKYIYILKTDPFIPSNSGIILCNVNDLDGSLNSCQDLQTIGATFTKPSNFVIQNGIAHIINSDPNDPFVAFCTIMNDGTFGLCQTVDFGISIPISIAMNNNITYISDLMTHAIYNCNLTDGIAGSCVNANASGVKIPYGISIRENKGYILDAIGKVFVCNIDAHGNLTPCANARLNLTPVLNSTYAISTNSNVVYITSFYNGNAPTVSVYACIIGKFGIFSTCQNNLIGSTQYPQTIFGLALY